MLVYKQQIVSFFNQQVIEALLKVGSTAVGIRNRQGLTPLQISASRCQHQNLELMIKFIRSEDHNRQRLVDVLWMKTERGNETLLHLACRYN
jgi:hypothetical protein